MDLPARLVRGCAFFAATSKSPQATPKAYAATSNRRCVGAESAHRWQPPAQPPAAQPQAQPLARSPCAHPKKTLPRAQPLARFLARFSGAVPGIHHRRQRRHRQGPATLLATRSRRCGNSRRSCRFPATILATRMSRCGSSRRSWCWRRMPPPWGTAMGHRPALGLGLTSPWGTAPPWPSRLCAACSPNWPPGPGVKRTGTARWPSSCWQQQPQLVHQLKEKGAVNGNAKMPMLMETIAT